jgi:hypothetical protein
VILTPAAVTSLEKSVQLIKGGSSFGIHKVRGQKMQIWQAGFHESRVTSWMDDQAKGDYLRFNPAALKLVARPELWPCGSACDEFVIAPIRQGLKPVGNRGG